jgi:two-component system LytT family response regulator/two-component system response regulator LytT
MNKEYLIRTIIIDDEEPARNELRYLLEQISDIKIVLETDNSTNLLSYIEKYQPHIVFMDIEMPQENGLKLAQKIIEDNLSPLIIFATAHEEFALKAFDLNAVDYILKPFSLKRITKCIEKVRTLLQNPVILRKPEGTNSQDQYNNKTKLALECNGKVVIINVNDIITAFCEEGQLLIHTKNKVYHSNMTLNELQMRLNNHFFRSHRAYLVNIEKILEVIPWFNGSLNLVMEGVENFEVPVSRHQAPKLKKIFGL